MTDRDVARNSVRPGWSEVEVAALEESRDTDSECSLQVHLDSRGAGFGIGELLLLLGV